MTTKIDRTAFAALIVLCVLLSGSALSLLPLRSERQSRPLLCAIEFCGQKDTTRGLVADYNYFLLKKFTSANPRYDGSKILLSLDSEQYLDTLLDGKADIIVLPLGESPLITDKIATIRLDTCGVWALRARDRRLLKDVERWLEIEYADPEHKETRERFLHTFNPYIRAKAGLRSKYLSPYDDIIRKYAAEMGWDWRLLAAVIYQESNFRITANSNRGASGLMQLMPGTAARMAVSSRLNPEESIKGGVGYLQVLYRRYRGICDSSEERIKYTLAAYNAGEGRVSDIIKFARARNVDLSCWDSVAVVLPLMSEATEADSLKFGAFNANPTLTYLEMIELFYDSMKRICPEQ